MIFSHLRALHAIRQQVEPVATIAARIAAAHGSGYNLGRFSEQLAALQPRTLIITLPPREGAL